MLQAIAVGNTLDSPAPSPLGAMPMDDGRTALVFAGLSDAQRESKWLCKQHQADAKAWNTHGLLGMAILCWLVAPGIAQYVYLFLGAMLTFALGSMLVYCLHQRRLRRFAESDNLNNNMQRHSLVDSFLEAGEVEWQCSVCYHENHPAKRECLMCGTPEVISNQVAASPAASEKKVATSFQCESADNSEVLAARNRSFHVRRLNDMNLNQRQRGARRRHLWQREKSADGQFRWVRLDHCQPSRLSVQGSDLRSSLPAGSVSIVILENERLSAPAACLYETPVQDLPNRLETGSNWADRDDLGIETELSMVACADATGTFSPTIKKRVPSGHNSSDSKVRSPKEWTMEDTFISQASVGYVRHVNEQGHSEWVPADSISHEDAVVTSIDLDEFPRASSAIDFESVAALPFRAKVRWFLHELSKVAVPWEEGHLLLKIRREAVLRESMYLLMLVPSSDLRQRLRIEFIDEPGLDAGGLLREWVLLLCEQLFDDNYGLFQRTCADHAGYWVNPSSGELHHHHLQCFEFVGRLLAKCLLEGQLVTVHLALPLLKHLLGVPISFSDLEFLDVELHRHALWLRENDGAEHLALDFTVQRQGGDGGIVTEELKPGGRDLAVTDANKEEYLTLLLKHKMFGGVQEQLEALLRGLYDVLPRSLLAVFDYQELELLLCGVPEIDVDDWKTHTDVQYLQTDQGRHKRTSSQRRVLQWFWDAVNAFSQEERARLLQFVTGTSRVPAEGFKALLSHDGCVRRFGIQLVDVGTPPAGLYPKAHTCFNRIDLPVYRSSEELVTYLTLVINMELTGFSMQ